MAGDLIGSRHADEEVENGVAPEIAIKWVGSFARFEWAVRNYPRELLLRELPDLWSGSDFYGDSATNYIELWREAYAMNGNQIIIDGQPLPPRRLKAYRGQLREGICWTLDKDVAKGFARFGGGRDITSGKVLTRHIDRECVLAYLTRRNESELIIDPGREHKC